MNKFTATYIVNGIELNETSQAYPTSRCLPYNMKPDFMNKTAKIIAEVMVRTCIDKLDTKVIEEILKDELNEYYNEVFKYSRNIGYDEGYNDDLNEAVAIEEAAYSRGFDDGRAEQE